MLSCEQARSLRMRWLAGEAPAARLPLAAHAATCPRCGKALAEQLARDEADREAFSPWAEAAGAARPDPGFSDRVMARLPRTSGGLLVPPPPPPSEGEMESRRAADARRRRFVRVWGAALAASLLLVAGTGALACLVRARRPLAEVVEASGGAQAARLPWSGFQAVSAGDRIPAGARLRTGAGARIRLRLPDGSEVDLGPGSRLALEGPRAARLEAGGVRVSAAKDPASWVLESPEGRVRTLGTVFSASLESEIPATKPPAQATSRERRSP